MPIDRALLAASAAFVLLLPAAATAQAPSQPQITLSYHEVIAADADTAPALIKIFERFRKDCEAIGKAYGQKCVISQSNVNTNTNYGGDVSGAKNLNANATLMLLPGKGEASPPSKPSQ